MPSFGAHGATIYYEEFGQGFPILTFAPAGLQSTIEVWSQPAAPINPTIELATRFRVIAMDQRNAGGRSHAPIRSPCWIISASIGAISTGSASAAPSS